MSDFTIIDGPVYISSSLATALRGCHISEQVREFHTMIDEPAPSVPTVPDHDAVRQRLALVLEECTELMEAAGMAKAWLKGMYFLRGALKSNAVHIAPNLVAMTDALADQDYVVEGTRQRFGIDGGPIANEVHRSNMAKRGAGKDAAGKWQKPEGWTPPDIDGELCKQGWKK